MLNTRIILEQNFSNLARIPVVNSLLDRLLKVIFHEKEYREFLDKNEDLSTLKFIKNVMAHFNFSYQLSDYDKSKIPESGKVVIYSNHPIGTLDGLLLLDLVSSVRSDVKIMANEVLSQIEPIQSMLLPVNNLQGGTVRENMKNIRQFLNDQGALIVFPAGEVSRVGFKGLRDSQWNSGFLKLAKQSDAPLLPVFVNAKNSKFFYFLSFFAKSFSALWLIREMFKHENNCVEVQVGDVIDVDSYHSMGDTKSTVNTLRRSLYAQFNRNTQLATVKKLMLTKRISKGQAFKQKVNKPNNKNTANNSSQIHTNTMQANIMNETQATLNKQSLNSTPINASLSASGVLRNIEIFEQLADQQDAHHLTSQPIAEAPLAEAEDRQLLRADIESGELLGCVSESVKVYLCRYHQSPTLMQELGRLRELSFRAVGEGTGQARDLDDYDQYYMHVVLWESNDSEIAGAYRLADAATILKQKGLQGLYSSTLFDYHPASMDIISEGLELGRSFVQPRYWGKRNLDFLWYGIGAFLRENPQYKYLFGPVSISDSYSPEAKDLLIYFYKHYFLKDTNFASAKDEAYKISAQSQQFAAKLFCHNDYSADFKTLKKQLKSSGFSVPTLYKQYTQLTKDGGCCFWDFNIDKNFANCVDGLVVVDISQVKAKKRLRYMGSEMNVDLAPNKDSAP